MIKKLKEIYDSIINNEIKIGAFQEIIDDKKLILKMGNNLENELMELNIVIEILEKEMQACKMCKEADEKNFSKSFLNYYGILCEFKNGYIVCNVGNVNNREEHYRNILKKYWHLLYKQGFDNENEFRQITQNYNKICASTNFLISFIDECYRRSKQERNGVIGIDILLQKLSVYNKIKFEYMKFINVLNDAKTRILSPETVQYILDNTSLIHLAYTNNKHKINGYSSSNRVFLCQFHRECTPSMRVSITKNFFNCFGCGNCGNQIDYVKDYENVSYDQATYLLAEVYLIDIPDNPYKEVENSLLVKKYRDVLLSDEYRNFLIDAYGKINKSVDLDNVYGKMFSQIDRIKAGKYDDNFSYHAKSKKYKYYIPQNK